MITYQVAARKAVKDIGASCETMAHNAAAGIRHWHWQFVAGLSALIELPIYGLAGSQLITAAREIFALCQRGVC